MAIKFKTMAVKFKRNV